MGEFGLIEFRWGKKSFLTKNVKQFILSKETLKSWH